MDGSSAIEGAEASPARNGGCAADAVTNGCLLVPANTVTRLSGSIRTCISAPTRLNRLARTFPVMSSLPETPTSALGALATIDAMGVAHHDVADAQCGAAIGIAFKLSAADGNSVMAAEILFDGGGRAMA